tara:strand:- start:317 stop:985 length:669 start_codon:yes stop_codon:yes gene_type:complete
MLNYILNKITKKNLYLNPYPHIIIENFLPDEFYNNLVNNYPNINNFKSQQDITGRKKDSKERFILYMNKKEDFLKLNNNEKNAWLSYQNIIGSEKFLNHIFSIFNKKKPDNFYSEIQIIYDFKNYEITPHCDKAKLLTCLFYMPDNNNYSNFGTELYTPSSSGNIISKKFNKKFNLVKKAPFTKNTLLIFIPEINKTWHGVSKIEKKIERKTIQTFLKPVKN